MKELHGPNSPKNIIKIEDLDVRLVGTIKEKKSGLETQISNAPDPARKNILVIATHGPPFKCAVAGERADTYLLSENLVEITLKPDVPAAYVAAYLNSSKGQKEFDKHRTVSTPFARITENNLKLFEIPLPHDAECQSVYKWFEHLYQYELELNRERDALSRIAAGILQNIGSEPAE
jgi:restriction endonuclease S subunit